MRVTISKQVWIIKEDNDSDIESKLNNLKEFIKKHRSKTSDNCIDIEMKYDFKEEDKSKDGNC